MEEFSLDVDNQMEELSLCAFAVLMDQIKSRRVEAPFMAFFASFKCQRDAITRRKTLEKQLEDIAKTLERQTKDNGETTERKTTESRETIGTLRRNNRRTSER